MMIFELGEYLGSISQLPSSPSPSRDGDLLLLEMAVRESEKYLTRSISPQLSAESALDNEIDFREHSSSSRDRSSALLAGDHEGCRIDFPLVAIVHAHGEILGKEKANTNSVVVDAVRYPTDCIDALDLVQEVAL